MRRWMAIALLVVMASFVAMTGADQCDDGPHHDHHHAQHFLCPDDCAPAMLPTVPQAPPPDPLPKAVFEETFASPVLDRDLEPEKAPPRA